MAPVNGLSTIGEQKVRLDFSRVRQTESLAPELPLGHSNQIEFGASLRVVFDLFGQFGGLSSAFKQRSTGAESVFGPDMDFKVRRGSKPF
jgi:hypothetical protein